MINSTTQPPATPPAATSNYISMEMGEDINPNPKRIIGYQDNDSDDAYSISPSIISSVMTADGIHDMPGFLVVCLVILVGDMSRGVFFPTLWPLVNSLGGTTLTLGYAVGAFSAGRIVSSPIIGSLSMSHGYTKTLLVSISILTLGNLLYTQVQTVGTVQFLIFAQCIKGLGSGTLGVTRAYVSEVTAKRQRTTYMAWITAVQYAGFTVTPFVGALLSKLFGSEDLIWGPFRFNMYTAPAYCMILLCCFVLYCITQYFWDRHRIATQKPTKISAKQAAVDEVANEKVACARWMTVYDACILGCMLLNVATRGSIASFETLGIAYAGSHFSMESQQAASIVATCGTLGVVALLSMGHLAQHFTDLSLILFGVLVSAGGIVSLGGVEQGNENNSQWRYIFAIFMIYSIGYPIGNTAVIGMFSKIVGRRPQGVLQGWFASAGSFARMTFPIMSGYIASVSDIAHLFYALTAILLVAAVFVLVSRKTLHTLSQ